jgi:hypothetical protein
LLDEIGISVVRDNLVGLNRENITVDALIEEQRQLSASKNPFERVVGSLCIAAILKEQLVGLPNSTIARLMTDYVWSDLNLLGPEIVIVEIASERLIEKYGTSLVCPECGAEFWRADE